jgi:DNA-binding CsgD family transcriptional regulator/catechol 2,3-dioxygenase-like lactoylglutathione lyase family enzyme
VPQRKRGRPPADDVLTPTEWRVLNAIRHGLSNPAIAKRRGISLDAVKFHVANIVSKLGVENRRALRTWQGAPKASALARTESHVMNAPASISAIGQIARSVTNVAASEAWYRDVLGLTHLFTFGTLAFFDVGGVRLFLSQQEAATPESILYLSVRDIRAAHATLQARGVEFIDAPHLIHTHADGTEEWMTFFNDPDGRPLALMSRVAVPRA